MRNFLGLFIGKLRKITTLFRSKRIHHRFLILAESIDSARRFSRLLELTEIDGNPVLQLSQDPVDEEVYCIAMSTDTDNEREDTKICWYLGCASRDKVRRWEMHLAEFKPDPQSGIWKKRFDSLIVCWPSKLLKNIDDSTIDLTLRLAGTIGKVKDTSRLKRVSFVVMDVNSEDGICHESQSIISTPYGERLIDALAKSMRSAKEQPGSGLADPKWSSFLEKYLGSENAFTRFYETVKRIVRTSSPIFFLPEARQHDRFQIPLLKWMAHFKPRRFHTIRKLGNAICFLGVLATIFVGLTYLNIVVSSTAVGEGNSGIDPGATVREIDGILSQYQGSVFGIVPAVIGKDTVEATISRLELTRDLTRLQYTTDCISDSTKSVIDEYLSETSTSREDCIEIVLNQLQHGLSDLTAFNTSYNLNSDRFKSVESLKTELISTSTSLAFFSMKLSEAPKYANLLIPARVDNILNEVSNITDTQLRDYFDRITSSSIFEFYDSVLLVCPSELYPVVDGSLNKLSHTLPRIPARDVIERIINKIRPETADVEFLEQLAEMRDRQFKGRSLLSQNEADSVESLLNDLRNYFAPRRIVIRFQKPGDEHWHLDFSRRWSGGYAPASWSGSGNDSGCYVVLERASVGCTVYLVCNSKSRTHTIPAGSDDPCTNSEVHTLIMDKEEGVIRFDSGRFTVNYEIIEGWSDWPPQKPEA